MTRNRPSMARRLGALLWVIGVGTAYSLYLQDIFT